MKITTLDYILIAAGLLMLPIFVGLVLLGVAMWRIGSRMEKEGKETSDKSSSPSADALEVADAIEEADRYIEEDMQDFAPVFLDKRYKLKQYSEDTLENGK